MPVDVFALAVELRAVVAFMLFLVVGKWTWDRIAGQGDDPTVSTSSFGYSGGLSVLVTGVHAVAVVVGLGVWLLWPTFMANPALLFIPVGLVMMHYYFEDVERGDSAGFFEGDDDD